MLMIDWWLATPPNGDQSLENNGRIAELDLSA
jgi:hypothetical protein